MAVDEEREVAQGSIERYEGKRGVSYRLRYVVGYDERGNPIHRRYTVRGTKREAEAKLRELQAQVDQGRYVEPSKLTVNEYMRRWFETTRQRLAPSTIRRYRDYCFKHIIPALGGTPLQKLTTMQVQEFANRMLASGNQGNGREGSGCSAKSVRDCVSLLRQALDQAIAWDMLTRNPATGVKTPKVTRRGPEILTEEQAAKALSSVEGTYGRIPSMIAYHTGMRIGEVLALSWDNVDLEKATVTVRRSYSVVDEDGPVFKDPKTRAGRRTVEIDGTLVKALREHRKAQAEARLAAGGGWRNEYNLVCTTENGGFIRPRALGHLFRRRALAVGLDVTFHGLRHTHVSLLIKAGVPINVISERVGHANPSITHNIYAHLLPGMGRDAALAFERLIRTHR
jgi:integrase